MTKLHAIKSKLPGMKTGSGHRLRNILVGTAYAFLLLSIIGMLVGPAPTDDTAGDSTNGSDAPAEESNQSESNTTSNDSNASDGGGGAADEDASENSTSNGTEGEPAEAVENTNENNEADAKASKAEQPAATAEEKAPESGSGPGPADMERAAAEQGIEIQVNERSNGDLETYYYSDAQDGEELAKDIGYISGLYAAVVDGGHESEQMRIEVRSMAGEPVGDYTVDAANAQAFANGNMTAEEFALTVLATGEVYEAQEPVPESESSQ